MLRRVPPARSARRSGHVALSFLPLQAQSPDPVPDGLFGLPVDRTTLVLTLGAISLVVGLILLIVLVRAARGAFRSIDQAVNPLPRGGLDAAEEGEGRRMTISQLPAVSDQIRRMLAGPRTDTIQLVDLVIQTGISLRASDIHFEPKEMYVALQYRVEGVLYDLAQIPPPLYQQVLTRLKVLSRIKTYVKDTPQDGRIRTEWQGGEEADLRVSLMPTLHGEKAVLRILQQEGLLYTLDQLGFHASVLPEYLRLIDLPQGIVFLTGPTGSGKTTTMYSSLREIKETRGDVVKMVTIEDPIEYDIDFLTQTQVNEAANFTFALGLRSILRQDPDVIMVGEIRDLETAGIAIQAGLSGHLLFTSVHANSAAGVFSRLINMGIEPFLLASASSATLSQRLVRRLCPSCAVEAEPSETELRNLRRLGADETGPFYRGDGCESCLGRGYLGRVGVFELLTVTEPIREAITAKRPAGEIERLARDSGAPTVVDDGLTKCREKLTSLAEVLRVASA